MGIEPTNHMISMRLNGFEDRGQHQLTKHFQMNVAGRPQVFASPLSLNDAASTQQHPANTSSLSKRTLFASMPVPIFRVMLPTQAVETLGLQLAANHGMLRTTAVTAYVDRLDPVNLRTFKKDGKYAITEHHDHDNAQKSRNELRLGLRLTASGFIENSSH